MRCSSIVSTRRNTLPGSWLPGCALRSPRPRSGWQNLQSRDVLQRSFSKRRLLANRLRVEDPPKAATGGRTQPSTDGASESTESDAGSTPGGQPGAQQRRREDKQQGTQHSGRLTELNRKVVTLVGSADRPMSPKDVVIPLVDKSAPRAEIERMRHRLNRLVNKGFLKHVGPGLYTRAEVDR